MSEQVSSTKKLVSASAIMASGTLISRVLGMLRVMLIVFILGSSTRQADIFELANTVPNSIYILFAGGALNTVLVPQIVRAIKHDPDGGEAYTNRIMTAFMLIVTAVTVLVTFGAPVIAAIYSSSSWRVPELASQYASLIALAYLTLPQIFFYGAFFLLGQVLNARDKFGPMMWAPIANNVVSILVLAIYFLIWGNDGDTSVAFTTGQLWMLGAGSTLGIAIQTAVLIPYVRKVGFRIRPRFDLKGTGLGKTFKLSVWTIAFVAVNQLALIVVQRLATSATATGSGAGLQVYNNAHLLWILPHSLITVSLATAMLPNASRLAASGDGDGVAAEFTKTVRLALIIIVPATVVFLALAGPISSVLFGHGPRGETDALLIAWSLMAFAVGLIPFTVQFVTLRTFYALEDTRTPFLLQVLIASVNALGAWLLVSFADSAQWVAPALGLAYSIAYLVGVLVSWQVLRRRIPGLDGGSLGLHILRLGLGSLLGGVAAYFLANWLMEAVPNPLLGGILACLAGGILILGPFLLVGRLLKVRELSSLGDLLRSKLGRARASSPVGELGDDQATMTIPIFVDDTPTRVSPVINDITADVEADGPVTVVRNRAPISRHSFDATAAAEVELPGITDPTSAALGAAPSDAPDPAHRAAEAGAASLGLDDSLFRPPAGTDPATAADADGTGDDGEPTGPIDLDSLFREEASHGIATVGTLLNTRYELVELLAERHGTETWRAHDQVLSRDVVVHVIAQDDERIAELMLAARKGAVATDSRFLRVLDADEITLPDQGIGAYVVAEFATGRSLTELLAGGPLSTIESAYIVRELADALAAMHAQGLFHEQLNPDNVIITSAGAVRLVGFGVEAALAGPPEGGNAWALREGIDVKGLGALLYASLVCHWPGAAAFGLPAAPIIAGEPAAPHTIAPGISPALDRIAVTTLTERGAAAERRITLASQLVGELNQVLGTADASTDLEQRVRAWRHAQLPIPAPAAPARAIAAEPGAAPASESETATILAPQVGPRASSTSETERPAQRPRRGLMVLLTLVAVTLVVSLFIVFLNGAREGADQLPPSNTTSAPGQSTSGTPAAAAITIVGASDFDPETDGGNGEELPELVGNVFDGDTSTSWKTMSYKNRPNLGGLKPGVGVILDLGEPRKVSAANLTLTGGATSIELRVPATDEPSNRTEKDWTVVGADAAATGTVTVPLTAPVETRYLMVYLTNLPAVGDRYIGELNEVTLS